MVSISSARARFLQDVKRGVHDFRADAVAVRDGNRCACHLSVSPRSIEKGKFSRKRRINRRPSRESQTA